MGTEQSAVHCLIIVSIYASLIMLSSSMISSSGLAFMFDQLLFIMTVPSGPYPVFSFSMYIYTASFLCPLMIKCKVLCNICEGTFLNEEIIM